MGIPNRVVSPEMTLQVKPTHSADLHKDSFVYSLDEMDDVDEKKGIMVTIFVIVCMISIVTIGIVALILKEPSVCSHPTKPIRGWLRFGEYFDGVIRNGTLAMYFCEKGWRLEGPELNQCLETGD